MISIYLNNEKLTIKPELSLQEFLLAHDCTQLHCAVAINNQFIPRPAYGATLLRERDKIDIIVPMQGG